MAEAYILIKVTVGSERDVVEKLQQLRELKDINELYGEWDIIARIQTDRIEDLDSILTEKIRAIPDVTITSTMIVAKYLR